MLAHLHQMITSTETLMLHWQDAGTIGVMKRAMPIAPQVLWVAMDIEGTLFQVYLKSPQVMEFSTANGPLPPAQAQLVESPRN